jgi:hypothetical protein
MPSALCDGPAWSVCNRETERDSGDSGLDKDNVCKRIISTATLKFQEFCPRGQGAAYNWSASLEKLIKLYITGLIENKFEHRAFDRF